MCLGTCGNIANVCSCCVTCSGCCGKSHTRTPYLIIQAIGVTMGLILRYWGKDLFNIDIYVDDFDACDTTKCVGYAGVYRVSFLCFFLSVIIALSLYTKSCNGCHTSHWCLKSLYFTIGLVLTFVMPNSFFNIYALIARFFSAFFLILQIIILIDFAYKWNDAWYGDEGTTSSQVALIVCGLLLYGGSLTIFIFSFDWFTEGSGCERNEAFIILTFIFTFIISVMSFTQYIENGTFITSATITLYCYFVLYSALASDPDTCNTLSNPDTVQVVIGIIVAVVAVTYAGWNLSNSKAIFAVSEEEAEQLEEVEMEVAEKEANKGDEDAPSEADTEETNLTETWRITTRRFHWIMALTSMYWAMVVTNWGIIPKDNDEAAYDLADETVYIKISSQWLTLLLYLWTLIAPLICPDRFSPE